jgi:hypothetical protein
MSGRKVILYELNEVPWAIVDRYIESRPQSTLADLLSTGQSLTTVVDDSVPLQPWRTWPTLHLSLNTADHNSFDLGQDPATFHGRSIWDAAEDAGLSVGLWGPLQSWPARRFKNGSFYIPDTFSSDARTYPESFSRFQAFNLRATRENSFSANAPLSATDVARVGVDLLRQGLTLRTAATVGRQLVRERRNPKYKGGRSIMQAPLNFDLYWRQHRRYEPDLSIFFTNHVAGMMHRFWGDADAEYARTHSYPADRIFGEFIDAAMDVADRQLATLRRYVSSRSDTMLLVAASMGQGPIDYRAVERVFVVEQADLLIAALGLPTMQVNLAMYPHVVLQLTDEEAAKTAGSVLSTVTRPNGVALFGDLRVFGSTVSFQVDNFGGAQDGEDTMSFAPLPTGSARSTASLGSLGITVQERLGGSNTAYHIPQGMAVAWGAGVRTDRSRKEVDLLDVAPSLLVDVLNVPADPSMKGQPGLFA